VEAEAKIQADLQAQEIAGDKRIAELRIKALRETIDKQAVQIDNFTKQLNAVLKQAQDLAVKALEGASTSGSLRPSGKSPWSKPRLSKKPPAVKHRALDTLLPTEPPFVKSMITLFWVHRCRMRASTPAATLARGHLVELR
jgi:hypothetical protein